MTAKPSRFIAASHGEDTARARGRRRSLLVLLLFGLVGASCTAPGPAPAPPAGGQDDTQLLATLEQLARERQTERPAAAAAALRFLSASGSGVELPDGVREEARRLIEALTASRTIGFRVTGPDTKPLPFVLATMTGENGTPVRGLYDTRIDLDDEGRGEIADVPPGIFSLRLHTLREFRSEEGYDLVAVHRLNLTHEDASFHSRLVPGGRFSVTLDSPARLVVMDDFFHPVATTIWRGEQGGWTTEFVPLTPAFTSCVLPPGIYQVKALRYRLVVAEGRVKVAAGTTVDLEMEFPR